MIPLAAATMAPIVSLDEEMILGAVHPDGPGIPYGANLGAQIEGILKGEPMARWSDGGSTYKFSIQSTIHKDLRNMREGRLCFPRFEGIHRLLSGKVDHEDVVAVENGPSSLPFAAATILELGGRVIVKEPSIACARDHRSYLIQHYGAELVEEYIEHARGSAVDIPVEADIAYWINPAPRPIIPEGYRLESIIEYLGRDVRPGGFLVIQSDLNSFEDIDYDAGRWEPIFSSPLTRDRGMEGFVMVTLRSGIEHSFQVLQRR